MTELDRLIDELERGYDGDPWHGSPTRTILDGVNAEGAAKHPIASAHSIWELVLHMTAWKREVRRRLDDGTVRELAGDSDWPPVGKPDPTAWREALDALDDAHEQLLASLRSLRSDRLDEQIGRERDRPAGSGVSYAVMLHGLAQHDAYHSGQIALLKKGVEASTSAR